MLARLIFDLFNIILNTATDGPNGFSDNRRVFQGYDVNITDYPWTLNLVHSPAGANYERSRCTGVIVGPYIALTAAHCLWKIDYPIQEMAFRAGSSKYYGDKRATYHRLRDVINHPNYIIFEKSNDIAVALVSEPFQFGPTRQSIKLAERSPQAGERGTITGWGAVGPDYEPPKVLQAADLTVIPPGECFKRFRNSVASNEFCTTDQQRDVCVGDSGGPFAISGVLYGLVSRGSEREQCYRKNSPAIFTDVFAQREWIERTIKIIKRRNGIVE